MDPLEHRPRVLARLGVQARTSVELGSPLYAELYPRIAADVEAGGLCWHLLAPYAHQPDGSALGLRFMAAVHRLVLRGMAPGLAPYYASVGGDHPPDAGTWPAFLATVTDHEQQLRALTALPCQTNEVGRSAALAPALAWLSEQHGGAAIHHYEIGTSAGLNLRWDHFHYGTADGATSWGPPESPVDLVGHWLVPPPRLPTDVRVENRRGCDPNPLDPEDPTDVETLTASVWGDQARRLANLSGALELAKRVPATLEAVGAGDWLDTRLPERPDHGITVVSHSVVWRYIPEDEQERVKATLETNGRDSDRPLVWLRLEPRPPATTFDGDPYPVTATTWPGARTEVLAVAHAHGQNVRWLGG